MLIRERSHIQGVYKAQLKRAGKVLWDHTFPNLITDGGLNFILNTVFAGASYSAAAYMGLISSAGFSGVAGADTISSHAGWLEAGASNAPTFAARQLCAWAAAGGGIKALSAPASFTFTGAGTVQGAFLALGGASSVIGNTGGTLISAGTLATPQAVNSGDTLLISYQCTLS